MTAHDLGALEVVECLEQQQFERRGFDPIDLFGKSGGESDARLFYKILDLAPFSQGAARAEMYDPISKTVVHHYGEFGERDLVAVQMYLAWRTVTGEVEYAVIALAEQVEVVLQLVAGIAGEVAEFRVLRF